MFDRVLNTSQIADKLTIFSRNVKQSSKIVLTAISGNLNYLNIFQVYESRIFPAEIMCTSEKS